MDDSQYWAAKPTEEIGKELKVRIDEYGEYLDASGLLSELRRSYEKYYGQSTIKNVGTRGELKGMRVNEYGSLIRSIHSMITSQRAAWEPRATNTDVKSQAQTILASGLLDYYAREKRMERYLKQAALTSLFLREGWVSVTWDATAGEAYGTDPSTGTPVMEGDVRYRIYRLNDVIRDVNKEDNDFDWLIVRDYVNKFDEAAKYPELADRIKSLHGEKGALEKFRIRANWSEREESVLIPKYTMFHRATDALPNGRMVEMLSDDLVTFDGSLPYRKVPLYPMTAEDMLETAFGHSPSFDLMPIQDAIDTLCSTVLTNQAAFGVQNVMVPKGSDLSVSSVTGGMNLIEYDSKLGPPQPLNLVQTPREIFEFITMLRDFDQTISGVNAVARGNASPQLSGAAMALLQSTALQFQAGIQQSYTQIVEDVGTGTIHLLADFATTKRVAYIVGKHNRSYLKEFSGDDIADISRVTVDSANALTKSIAGRTEIANQLLNAGLIKRPEQYFSVLQTGQLEPMYENETAELLLIRAENEGLSEGKPQRAVVTDDHALHIMEHKSVMASPEARTNNEIVDACTAHIQEHIYLLKTSDPMLLGMLGQQSLMAPPPAGPQGPQAAPTGVPGAMSTDQNPAGNVQQPNMPTNPMTGEQFDPAAGQ
jgi:hypothetical protein